MKGYWNLDVLYRGYDDPRFDEDQKKLDEAIERFRRLADGADELDDVTLAEKYIDINEEIALLAGRISVFAELKYCADTSDSLSQSTSGRLMAKLSALAAPDASLRRRIGKADVEGIISASPRLAKYRYYLENIVKDGKYLLADGEEEVFSRMNISGAGAWEEMRSALTSSAKAEYRGKELTLTELRQLASDADPDVRRDAYDAEIKCCAGIEKPVAFALNSIKLQVINECEMRGFASPLDKALYDSRMKKETLDALWSAVYDHLPAFHRFLRAKARLLGYDGPLKWWDLFAPAGKSGRKFTDDEAKEYLLSIFSGVDGELRDLVERAFDNDWIDMHAREGKVGGAFDCGLPGVPESRILTNFRGDMGDVVTLAHELGHAFHDLQVSPNSELCRGYTMPVAETASTFNENLILSRAIASAQSREEKILLIEGQLTDAAQIICDILSRFLFESAVFARRPEEFLDAGTLCAMMTEAQKKAYGDGLDADTLNPYMWLSKSHYYSGSLSFYNFPYAFGGLFARSLYAKYEKEGKAFFEVYRGMLKKTPSLDVEDCAAIAGIDLTDKGFWEEGLVSFEKEIDEFCRLVDMR